VFNASSKRYRAVTLVLNLTRNPVSISPIQIIFYLFFKKLDDFYLMEASFELAALTMLRYVVQTCAVLNDHK
jgi:hypothetical protein